MNKDSLLGWSMEEWQFITAGSRWNEIDPSCPYNLSCFSVTPEIRDLLKVGVNSNNIEKFKWFSCKSNTDIILHKLHISNYESAVRICDFFRKKLDEYYILSDKHKCDVEQSKIKSMSVDNILNTWLKSSREFIANL